jgi:glycosyltransferase involved in cell wall biosynthesis
MNAVAMQPLRILHVVPTYLPALRYGGPIQSVHSLCAALVRQGHSVDVATTNVDGPGDSAVALETRVDLDGVGVHYFPSRLLRRLYYAPRLRHWLRAHIADYDVVHLHSVFLWPTLIAARLAVQAGRPYVLSPRGMLVRELVQARSRWLKSAWIALFERRTLRQAAAVHLTSVVESEALQEFMPGVNAQLDVIRNGVDEPARDQGTSAQPVPPYVLVLGRISWKKRIERAIEAIAAVPGLRLVVAGGDDEGLLPALRDCAKKWGVADRVEFAGQVQGERKQALLRDARALLMVSLTENYGNVVLEAMACGTPAIVVPQIGAAEAVQASAGGWVIADSVDALQTKLQELLAQPELAVAAGSRAACWVAAEASWSAVAVQMSRLYRRIEERRTAA